MKHSLRIFVILALIAMALGCSASPTSGNPSDNTGTLPGTDTPGADDPGTDTPGTDTPNTDTPSAGNPGTTISGAPGINTDETYISSYISISSGISPSTGHNGLSYDSVTGLLSAVEKITATIRGHNLDSYKDENGDLKLYNYPVSVDNTLSGMFSNDTLEKYLYTKASLNGFKITDGALSMTLWGEGERTGQGDENGTTTITISLDATIEINGAVFSFKTTDLTVAGSRVLGTAWINGKTYQMNINLQ